METQTHKRPVESYKDEVCWPGAKQSVEVGTRRTEQWVSKAYNISHSAADAPAHSALVNSSITWTHVLRVFGKYRNHMSTPRRHVVSSPDTDLNTPHWLYKLLGMFMWLSVFRSRYCMFFHVKVIYNLTDVEQVWYIA